MIIYNKEPISVLWDITKGLKSKIPIYMENMNEEESNIPNSYILLRSQSSDTTKHYGDGKTIIRIASCDIVLVTKGYADDSTDLHNKNKTLIRKYLKDQEINFTEFNLGYNDGIRSTEHTFTLEVEYLG